MLSTMPCFECTAMISLSGYLTKVATSAEKDCGSIRFFENYFFVGWRHVRSLKYSGARLENGFNAWAAKARTPVKLHMTGNISRIKRRSLTLTVSHHFDTCIYGYTGNGFPALLCGYSRFFMPSKSMYTSKQHFLLSYFAKSKEHYKTLTI
jgi:hypothetical protein